MSHGNAFLRLIPRLESIRTYDPFSRRSPLTYLRRLCHCVPASLMRWHFPITIQHLELIVEFNECQGDGPRQTPREKVLLTFGGCQIFLDKTFIFEKYREYFSLKCSETTDRFANKILWKTGGKVFATFPEISCFIQRNLTIPWGLMRGFFTAKWIRNEGVVDRLWNSKLSKTLTQPAGERGNFKH